jgi:hypothetical protein
MESGKVIAEASWKVSVVSAPKAPLLGPTFPSTPITPQAPSIVFPQSRLATLEEKEKLATWMPPRFIDGIMYSKLVLSWRQFGLQSTGFVVAEKKYHNSITDRTGELPSDQWIKVKGESVSHEGIWELEIPMPLPGTHTYVVYPDGVNSDGKEEKIISPLIVGITWKLFAWPVLRLLLALLFIVCLVKVIRRRF